MTLQEIDPFADDLITFDEATKILPGRPHRHTIYRWAKRSGLRGIRLPSLLINKTLYTTKSALREFIQATSQPRIEADDKPEGGRRKRVDRAKRRLASSGI